jgi:hypothetical protein
MTTFNKNAPVFESAFVQEEFNEEQLEEEFNEEQLEEEIKFYIFEEVLKWKLLEEKWKLQEKLNEKRKKKLARAIRGRD